MRIQIKTKVDQNIDLHSILDQAGIGCLISLMQSMNVLVAEKYLNFMKEDFLILLIESIIMTQAHLAKVFLIYVNQNIPQYLEF